MRGMIGTKYKKIFSKRQQNESKRTKVNGSANR